MAIFSCRPVGLGDLTDNTEERLRGDMRVLECRIGRIEAAMFNWRAGTPEPPAEEVERLRRKVAAGEKLAALVRAFFEARGFSPFANDALRAWEEADE